jgi:hypothetical protein
VPPLAILTIGESTSDIEEVFPLTPTQLDQLHRATGDLRHALTSVHI